MTSTSSTGMKLRLPSNNSSERERERPQTTGRASNTSTGNANDGQTNKRRRTPASSSLSSSNPQGAPSTQNLSLSAVHVSREDIGKIKWPTSTVEQRVAAMRRNVALTYDTLLVHALNWGPLSIAWGPRETNGRTMVGDEGSQYPAAYNDEQIMYYTSRSDGEYAASERTWNGQPSEIFVSRIALPKRRTTRKNQMRFHEDKRSTRVSLSKRIIHPGEVNRLRVLQAHPHLLAAHTDVETVFFWNTQTQQHRPMPGDNRHDADRKKSIPASTRFKCNVPDLELVGHTMPVKYGLDGSTLGTRILSGSISGKVLCWDVADVVSNAVSQQQASTTNTPGFGRQLQPRYAFFKEGHKASVEDCCFNPTDDNLAISVGTDRQLLVWDARQTNAPAQKLSNAHMDDLNCCSWNPLDTTKVATGGSDRQAKIFDLRKLARGKILDIPHAGAVINVRWSPHARDVLMTTDEGIWCTMFRLSNLDVADGSGVVATAGNPQARFLFHHMGHRTMVMDIAFNPHDEFVISTVSDDSSLTGGGALQTWRVNELVYRNPYTDPEWAAELEAAMAPSTVGGAEGGPSLSDNEGGNAEED